MVRFGDGDTALGARMLRLGAHVSGAEALRGHLGRPQTEERAVLVVQVDPGFGSHRAEPQRKGDIWFVWIATSGTAALTLAIVRSRASTETISTSANWTLPPPVFWTTPST